MSGQWWGPTSGVVPEKLIKGEPGALEDLRQRGAFHFSGVVGHGKVDRGVQRVGEEVVASVDMVQGVSRVLEGTNNFSRLEGRDARRHPASDDDRHALGDGAPESGSSLAGNRLSALS